MKKYQPITTSAYTFEDNINGNYVYVDKTDYFYRLVSEPIGIFFMSRPRRFGKSLSVSILNSIFKGKKDLFKGLKIYDSDYTWEDYPVINLNISEANCTSIEILHRSLCNLLHKSARELQLSLSDQANSALLFGELLEKASQLEKGKLVILIDEYDKPLVEDLDVDYLKKVRQVMGDFYLNIKSNDKHLRFVFMTGVTKFSKVSAFSNLNNLNDISMDSAYACMYGYTEDELTHYFGDQLNDLAVQHQQDPADYREEIRRWYNGFRFSKNAPTVYNPVSIGMFILEGGDFSNFWFTTGNPSFLMKVLRSKEIDFFKTIKEPISDLSLDSFDMSDIDPAPLLLQTGYLTIDRTEKLFGNTFYHLRFPNYEIESAFEQHLVAMLSRQSFSQVSSDVRRMQIALLRNDTATLRILITAHIASIPYGERVHTEKTYQNIIFSLLRLIGAEVNTEVYLNTGRIDALIVNPTHVYIIEFKIDQSATKAIAQIKEKGYMQPYIACGKTIVLIGINFSSEARNIQEWEEEVSSFVNQ